MNKKKNFFIQKIKNNNNKYNINIIKITNIYYKKIIKKVIKKNFP